jgi:hypothetical protein
VFWRCPRASIPADRDARIDWLYREWERLDAWVGARGEGGADAACRPHDKAGDTAGA